jgi:hypothetical protein
VQAAGVHRDEVGAALAQQGEQLVVGGAGREERVVADLDRVAPAGGQAGEERAQPRQLRGVEPRRQLEEQGAELVAERRDPVKVASSAPPSISSLSWLISRGNLKQNRKSSGTWSRQRATTSAVGSA